MSQARIETDGLTLRLVLLGLKLIIGNFILIPINMNLLLQAFLTIYIGAHDSLLNDAGMFPVFGSFMLLSLYVVFKLFDKEYVNMLLLAYFIMVGTFALASAISPLKEKKTNGSNPNALFCVTIPLPKFVDDKPLVISPDFSQIIAFLLATINATVYLKTKHWCANNIFGCVFSLSAIKQIKLGSYKIGCLLLIGLFFYDIFWVFGTDVMVTVAKSFDAPIKLLFPREFATIDTKMQFSMLGLGDIVMPGIFLALLLRFDFKKSQKGEIDCVDLSVRETATTTVFVMYTFKAAQPALLYLVPACLLSSFLPAYVLVFSIYI
eukprot:GSMAST32.ASY1.ANO1.2563.1 assembled CDS